jgi:hypothetical protein
MELSTRITRFTISWFYILSLVSPPEIAVRIKWVGSVWLSILGFLEQLHPCSVCNPARVFLTSKSSYLLLPNDTPKIETGTGNGSAKGWFRVLNSNPAGPIKPSR